MLLVCAGALPLVQRNLSYVVAVVSIVYFCGNLAGLHLPGNRLTTTSPAPRRFVCPSDRRAGKRCFSIVLYSCILSVYMFCALVLLSFNFIFPHHTTPARKHRVLLGQQIIVVAIAIDILVYILERGLVLCGHAFSFKYSGNYQCF